MKIFAALLITLMLVASAFALQQEFVTPTVSAAPDPVAVGSPVTVTQTLTNSCSGQGNVTFWTHVASPCDGNSQTLEQIRNQKVPSGGSVTYTDSYTPWCAGTYTVTTTVQLGPQKFSTATATFVAQ